MLFVLGAEHALRHEAAAARFSARVPRRPPVERDVDQERDHGHPRRIEVNGTKVFWKEISEGLFQIPVDVDHKALIKIILEGILA